MIYLKGRESTSKWLKGFRRDWKKGPPIVGYSQDACFAALSTRSPLGLEMQSNKPSNLYSPSAAEQSPCEQPQDPTRIES